MLHRSLAVLVVMMAARSASAALAANALPEKVAKHAHLVVRGTVDHEKKTVRVIKVYGGATAPETLTVVNLRKFGMASMPDEFRKKALLAGAACTEHAIVFLTELDGKYWLVKTSSPSWIPAYAAIKYVDAEGKILGYHQQINPGSVGLVHEEHSLAEIEVSIERWLKKRPAAPSRRKPLAGEERKAFWALVTPWMDFATRKLTRTPSPGKELKATMAAFTTFIRSHDGEARSRAIEALLILGKSKAPGTKECRAAVEAALAALANDPGREAIEPTLLAELASLDVFSEKELAGKTLVLLGPESAKKGRDVLEKIIAAHRATIESRAYWALRSMGFHAEAEKARQKKPGESK